MQWMPAYLLATTTLLFLTPGIAAEQITEEEELPTQTSRNGLGTGIGSSRLDAMQSPFSIGDGTENISTICSLTFDSVGPFCQFVVPADSGTCQAGFSMDTCNSCQAIVQLCGRFDGDMESICQSNLASSCIFLETNPSSFIMDYCSVVQSVCNGQSSGEASASGSGIGSGSASGVSGSGIPSGSGSGIPSGSGSGILSGSGSGIPSGSGSGILSGSGSGIPSGSGSGILSGSGSGIASGSGSGIGSGSGVGTTVIPTTGSPETTESTTTIPTTTISTTTTVPSTTPDIESTAPTTTVTIAPLTTVIPVVLVVLEALTEQQRENIVTVGFSGLNVEQFLENGITAFRQEIATAVNNDLLLNQGPNRKRRQAQPEQVSPDDVIVIDPLRMVGGELLVSFVVGGQGDQTTPVNGTILANLLEVEGPSLAMLLSNETGQPVQFVEAFTDTATEQPTTGRPTSEPTTITPPPSEQQEQQLSSGAIAGIVIAVLVVVLLLALAVVAAAALAIGYTRSGKMKLIPERSNRAQSLLEREQEPEQRYVQVSTQDGSHFVSNWQAIRLCEGKEYLDKPVSAQSNGNSDDDDNTEL